jgi:hypothetical protein
VAFVVHTLLQLNGNGLDVLLHLPFLKKVIRNGYEYLSAKPKKTNAKKPFQSRTKKNPSMTAAPALDEARSRMGYLCKRSMEKVILAHAFWKRQIIFCIDQRRAARDADAAPLSPRTLGGIPREERTAREHDPGTRAAACRLRSSRGSAAKKEHHKMGASIPLYDRSGVDDGGGEVPIARVDAPARTRTSEIPPAPGASRQVPRDVHVCHSGPCLARGAEVGGANHKSNSCF